MMPSDSLCVLCGLEAPRRLSGFDEYYVDCRRCGKYRFSRRCSANLDSADNRTLAAISAATRQANENSALLGLTPDNWDQVVAAHSNTPVRQKVTKLLRYLAAQSQFPGDSASFDGQFDYPTCDAATSSECNFLIEHLRNRGYLDLGGSTTLKLSVKGWEEVEPPAGTAGIPGRCFVAMSFAEEMDEAYLLGIKPAVEQDCGMTAVRMKELHHNQDICDRILSEIRQAQFVIADFTDPRYGVYYEAGYARALGREVINCCREDDFGKLHFDTNHLNHIKWTTTEDLRQKLADRIRQTITIR